MATELKGLWRAHKWKVIHFHLGAGLALLVAFALGAFASHGFKKVFGQELDPSGQKAYSAAQGHTEFQQRLIEKRPANAAAASRANDQAGDLAHPHPLASPQPVTYTALVRNFSSRAGARPELWVVHDAEMPNEPSLQSLRAITAWFNNPSAQASSNYATDAWGNTVLMVPTTAKAWHVAWFNPWAIGDELIGYASQRLWPVAQLRAAAQLAAHDAVEYGIPIRHGLVIGCTIIKPGIVEHADLGNCGGGHHDPGTNFPLTQFIALVAQYAAALRHPVPAPTPAPAPKAKKLSCTLKNVQLELNKHGARPKLVVDGVYGTHTKQAVIAFQRAHRLGADGVVGPRTGAALGLGGCK